MIHNEAVQPGERFGHLITLKRYQMRGGSRWSCWCVCGRFMSFRQGDLLSGRKSCGVCRAKDRRLINLQTQTL